VRGEERLVALEVECRIVLGGRAWDDQRDEKTQCENRA
jgi:hypothetical protein